MSGMVSIIMGIFLAFALEYILKQIAVYRLKQSAIKGPVGIGAS